MVVYPTSAYSFVRFTIPLFHSFLLHKTSGELTGVICPGRHLINFELLSFGLVNDKEKCDSNDCDFWFRACIVGECGVNDGVLLFNTDDKNDYIKGSNNDSFELQYDNRKNNFTLLIQLLDDDSTTVLLPREAWKAFDLYNRNRTYADTKNDGSNQVSCVWQKTHFFELASYSANVSNSTGPSGNCNTDYTSREGVKKVKIEYNFIINITRNDCQEPSTASVDLVLPHTTNSTATYSSHLDSTTATTTSNSKGNDSQEPSTASADSVLLHTTDSTTAYSSHLDIEMVTIPTSSTESTTSTSSSDNIPWYVIGVVLGIGFVAFVGILIYNLWIMSRNGPINMQTSTSDMSSIPTTNAVDEDDLQSVSLQDRKPCLLVEEPSQWNRSDPLDLTQSTSDVPTGTDSSTIISMRNIFEKAAVFKHKTPRVIKRFDTSKLETVTTSIPPGHREDMNPRAELTTSEDCKAHSLGDWPIEFLKHVFRHKRRQNQSKPRCS